MTGSSKICCQGSQKILNNVPWERSVSTSGSNSNPGQILLLTPLSTWGTSPTSHCPMSGDPEFSNFPWSGLFCDGGRAPELKQFASGGCKWFVQFSLEIFMFAPWFASDITGLFPCSTCEHSSQSVVCSMFVVSPFVSPVKGTSANATQRVSNADNALPAWRNQLFFSFRTNERGRHRPETDVSNHGLHSSLFSEKGSQKVSLRGPVRQQNRRGTHASQPFFKSRQDKLQRELWNIPFHLQDKMSTQLQDSHNGTSNWAYESETKHWRPRFLEEHQTYICVCMFSLFWNCDCRRKTWRCQLPKLAQKQEDGCN